MNGQTSLHQRTPARNKSLFDRQNQRTQLRLPLLWMLMLALAFGSAACSQAPQPTAQAADGPPQIIQATATPLPPAETQSAPPTATPDTAPPPTSEHILTDLSVDAADIRLFPVPRLISGDRMTVQILAHAPQEVAVDKVGVDIYIDDQIVYSGTLGERNWAGLAEGIFEWVWDTRGKPGEHTLRVVLDGQDLIQVGDEDPANNVAELTFQVGKAGERPLEERDVVWIAEENDCCVLHVLEQTAAYRDLGQLKALVDAAVSEASSHLDEMPDEPIDVYFIERTIGQGGFAGSDMVVTYTDRPYIGGELYELLLHEAVHVLDRQFAPQRTKLLAEGVAVWATGGHYKPEDLQQRNAALLQLNEYIPLATLANNFYPAQHEIGYLQAGGLVDFLVERNGWPAFRDFYSDTAVTDGATEAEALDANLRSHYDLSLAELEIEWLAYLETLSPSETEVQDLAATVRYFETARRYQTQYDPAAYFLTAWLPHPAKVQESGNTADLTRRPQSAEHVTLEILLRTADAAIEEQDFARANVILDSVNRILDQEGAFNDPLADSYLRIVRTAMNYGYEPQDIAFGRDTAEVLVTTASGFHLSKIVLEQRRGDWVFLAN